MYLNSFTSTWLLSIPARITNCYAARFKRSAFSEESPVSGHVAPLVRGEGKWRRKDGDRGVKRERERERGGREMKWGKNISKIKQVGAPGY